MPLEGVTTRGLGEEAAEGGGCWGFLSRRKVNLPSRELMEDMCVVSAHRLRGRGKERRKGNVSEVEERREGGEEGGCKCGVEVRRGKDKAELGIREKGKNQCACQQRKPRPS